MAFMDPVSRRASTIARLEQRLTHAHAQVNPSTLQHHIAFEAIDAFYAASGNRWPGASMEMTDSLTGTGDIEAIEAAIEAELAEFEAEQAAEKAAKEAGLNSIAAAASTSTRDLDSEPEKKRQRSDSPYVPTNSGGAGSSAMAATASGDAEMKTATPLLADEDAGSDDGDEKGQQSWEQDLAQCLALLERPGGILNKWGLTDKRGNDIGTGADLVRESVREMWVRERGVAGVTVADRLLLPRLAACDLDMAMWPARRACWAASLGRKLSRSSPGSTCPWGRAEVWPSTMVSSRPLGLLQTCERGSIAIDGNLRLQSISA